jgi:hypothetical protein
MCLSQVIMTVRRFLPGGIEFQSFARGQEAAGTQVHRAEGPQGATPMKY